MATYSKIKSDLKINVDKHLNDGFAQLTHFWQNHENGVSKYFKKEGIIKLRSSTTTSFPRKIEYLARHTKSILF